MDPLSVVGSTLAVASLILTYVTRENFRYQYARFGIAGHVFGLLSLVHIGAVRRLHWNINTWTDGEVLTWKASYMASCGAIQVAVSISIYT